MQRAFPLLSQTDLWFRERKLPVFEALESAPFATAPVCPEDAVDRKAVKGNPPHEAVPPPASKPDVLHKNARPKQSGPKLFA
jgi:hypothetical protein